MSALWLWLCLVPLEQQPLLRVVYDVQITQGDKQISALMVLNQRDAQSLSIHCRKNTAGTLFTYWATAGRDTLYFPRESVAFVGDSGTDFELFPNGPELSRAGWLRLLFEESSEDLGPFSMTFEEEWRVLRSSREGWSIRWKERSRSTKKKYGSKVLTPTLKYGTRVRPIAEMQSWWETED